MSLKSAGAIARADDKAKIVPAVNLGHPAHQNVVRVHQLSAITIRNTSQETKGQLPISCQKSCFEETAEQAQEYSADSHSD